MLPLPKLELRVHGGGLFHLTKRRHLHGCLLIGSSSNCRAGLLLSLRFRLLLYRLLLRLLLRFLFRLWLRLWPLGLLGLLNEDIDHFVAGEGMFQALIHLHGEVPVVSFAIAFQICKEHHINLALIALDLIRAQPRCLINLVIGAGIPSSKLLDIGIWVLSRALDLVLAFRIIILSEFDGSTWPNLFLGGYGRGSEQSGDG